MNFHCRGMSCACGHAEENRLVWASWGVQTRPASPCQAPRFDHRWKQSTFLQHRANLGPSDQCVSVAYLQTQKLGQLQLPSAYHFSTFLLMCREMSGQDIYVIQQRTMHMKYSAIFGMFVLLIWSTNIPLFLLYIYSMYVGFLFFFFFPCLSEI